MRKAVEEGIGRKGGRRGKQRRRMEEEEKAWGWDMKERKWVLPTKSVAGSTPLGSNHHNASLPALASYTGRKLDFWFCSARLVELKISRAHLNAPFLWVNRDVSQTGIVEEIFRRPIDVITQLDIRTIPKFKQRTSCVSAGYRLWPP